MASAMPGRQREPTQPPAEVGHGRRILLGQPEAGCNRPGSLDKQPDCRCLSNLLETEPWLGNLERRHPPDALASDQQRLARGGEDTQVRARGKQLVDQARASLDQM